MRRSNLDRDRVGAQKFAYRGKLMIGQSVFSSGQHLSETGWQIGRALAWVFRT